MPIVAEDVKENVRVANDIVEVIGSYITVKRAGSTYKALCPFHQEKTPSFIISQKRQSYHCFGCGAGGDVFRFVMEYEGVDFPTALKMLADRAGIAIRMSNEDPRKKSDKDRIYAIHEKLAGYYSRMLRSKSGKEAWDYLRSREIDDETIDAFRIGYAPSGNQVLDWGKKNGFNRDHLVKAGVLVRKETDFYDRFRGRIMFPICDAMGRVIGFSGRILKADSSPAKYLNTPETLLFKKSRVLYGLHRARKPMIDARWAMVCEGQIDCIRCQISGFANTVAPQGTALTEQQAHILKRNVDSVVLLFDPDEAGRKAAIRSASLLLAQGISVRIANLPADSDPDTLLREKGHAAMKRIVDGASSAVIYLVDNLTEEEDISTDSGLLRITQSALEMVSHCQSAVQRDRMIQEIAKHLDINESSLQSDFQKTAGKKTQSRNARSKENSSPELSALEWDALRYLYNHSELISLAKEYLPGESFTSSACRKLFLKMISTDFQNESGLARKVSEEDSETIKLAAMLDVSPPPQTDKDYSVADAFKHIIVRMRYNQFRRQRNRIKQRSGQDSSDIEYQARLTHWISSMKGFMHSKDWESAEILLKTVSNRLTR